MHPMPRNSPLALNADRLDELGETELAAYRAPIAPIGEEELRFAVSAVRQHLNRVVVQTKRKQIARDHRPHIEAKGISLALPTAFIVPEMRQAIFPHFITGPGDGWAQSRDEILRRNAIMSAHHVHCLAVDPRSSTAPTGMHCANCSTSTVRKQKRHAIGGKNTNKKGSIGGDKAIALARLDIIGQEPFVLADNMDHIGM